LNICSCYTYHSDTITITKPQIYWTLYECELSWLWTPLWHHVHVSWLHGHSSTLDTVFHVNICYIEYCYFIYMYHRYTDIVTHDTIISYSCSTDRRIHSLDTVISYICTIATWILCTQLYHVYTPLLHGFTGIHALIVSVFLLHGSLFILYELLLHGYSCIPVT